MRRLKSLGVAFLSGVYALCGAGCTGTTPPAAGTGTAGTTASADKHDDHDHDHDHDHDKDHDHDHDHDKEGHQHADKGPRDGVLVMFEGHKAHLELVFDAKTGTITAYPLDGHAEKELPIEGDTLEMSYVGREENAEPELVTLKKAEGTPVRFVGQADGLKGKEKWNGAFTDVKIGGAEYKGTNFKFPEGNHGH